MRCRFSRPTMPAPGDRGDPLTIAPLALLCDLV
jgi:hypothetical protein